MLVNLGGDNFLNYYVYFGFYCLYLVHYTLNFAIYAARSEQYRQAYIYFINEVCSINENVMQTSIKPVKVKFVPSIHDCFLC